MNQNVQDILNELPVTVVEDPAFDDTELVLYIQRLKNGESGESFFCFYAPDDDGDMVNGTLSGAGLTMVEALNELLHNYKTEYPKWLADQKESIE